MLHYLVLAHKGPTQIRKLVDALSSNESRVYIHLDQKSTDVSLLSLDNVEYIINRTHVEWGGYSMIHATLMGIEQIFTSMSEDDHLIILSGQDFPIQSQKRIVSFFKQNSGKSFLEYRVQPNNEWNILNRVVKYHFHDLRIPTFLDNYIKKILALFYPVHIIRNQAFCYIWQRIVNFFLPAKKYLIRNYKIYWGSSWMAISQKHIHYIIDFLLTKEGSKYIRSFKTVAGPDELFFQTLLLNSPHKDEVENDLLWYIDWHTGPGLPRILDDSDFDRIEHSTKLFARKFEDGISDSVINRIINNF